jgi:hypothetical protein
LIGATIRRARLAGELARTLGPGWVLYRAKHAVELRAGLVERRLPAIPWEEAPLAGELTDPALADPNAYLAYRRQGAPAFFFAPQDRAKFAPLLRAWDTAEEGPIRAADEVKAGSFRFFSRASAELGPLPAWQRNAFTGQEMPRYRHWSRLDDFGSGDIKVIWEPSRFAFVYDLVRAYWRTGDNTYAERFWQLVESWRAANPPQCGPNWKCGQETSFRVMAWCFGLYGVLDAPATTAARVVMLAEMIALSGHRIEAMVEYALSQQNNHGVSEGVGLWTIGSLFPELKSAAAWRERGRAILERLGRELIYEDGAFSQHSLNYHRVMLHDYLWAMRLGELHGRVFSPALYECVGKAVDLLYQLQDEVTGQVPCYGANDGALILPLSNSDYPDYRPAVQATRFLTTRTRTYEAGPWDEAALWLFGDAALAARVAEPDRRDLRAPAGGYVVLRSANGLAFTRCAAFRHRPGHADLLHVDLWWRGINVALDPGTYSYNSPAPWNTGLASTAYHNTLTIDGRDQMDKAGRFLWLPWARATVRFDVSSESGSLAYWEGEHDGYQRLPAPATHRRGILRIGDDRWLILDESRSAGEHDHRLHWLLADLPHKADEASLSGMAGQHTVTLATPAGDFAVSVGSMDAPGRFSIVRADVDSTRGWRSAYYLDRGPAPSLALDVRAASLRLWSLFGPAGASVSLMEGALEIAIGAAYARVTLGRSAEEPVINTVTITGSVTDQLEVGR